MKLVISGNPPNGTVQLRVADDLGRVVVEMALRPSEVQSMLHMLVSAAGPAVPGGARAAGALGEAVTIQDANWAFDVDVLGQRGVLRFNPLGAQAPGLWINYMLEAAEILRLARATASAVSCWSRIGTA